MIRGWWGSRRPPRSRVSAGVRRLRLRFSRVASQALVPNNNSPDRSSSPCPGAPRMRRFYISARERRTLAARDSISSVLHAASNPFCPGVFSDLRDTEAKRTAQRSPNTPRVLRAESRAIFSCVKRLHTANKQGALCERCVTARRRRAFHTRRRKTMGCGQAKHRQPYDNTRQVHQDHQDSRRLVRLRGIEKQHTQRHSTREVQRVRRHQSKTKRV